MPCPEVHTYGSGRGRDRSVSSPRSLRPSQPCPGAQGSGRAGRGSHGCLALPHPPPERLQGFHGPRQLCRVWTMGIVPLEQTLGQGSGNPEPQACGSSPRSICIVPEQSTGAEHSWQPSRRASAFAVTCTTSCGPPCPRLSLWLPPPHFRCHIPCLPLVPSAPWLFLRWIPLPWDSEAWPSPRPSLYPTHSLGDLSQT